MSRIRKNQFAFHGKKFEIVKSFLKNVKSKFSNRKSHRLKNQNQKPEKPQVTWMIAAKQDHSRQPNATEHRRHWIIYIQIIPPHKMHSPQQPDINIYKIYIITGMAAYNAHTHVRQPPYNALPRSSARSNIIQHYPT